MRQPAKRLLQISVFLCCGWTGVFGYYNATRGRIINRSAAERRKNTENAARWIEESGEEGRAGLCGICEYLLDYPDDKATSVKMRMASAVAYSSNPDWSFVVDTVQKAALDVAASANGDPSKKQFHNAGFECDSEDAYRYRYSSWPQPFVTADVDGDGRRDIILVQPQSGPGVCLLLRHTQQGWKANALSFGARILQIATFRISKAGPVAIVVLQEVSGAYDPQTLFDVFVCSNGRVRNVLSTTITHGWQWEHRDLDGSGIQAVRLVSRNSAPAWGPNDPHRNIWYRWNGADYKLANSPNSTDNHAVNVINVRKTGPQSESGPAEAQDIGENADTDAQLAAIEAQLFQEKRFSSSLEALKRLEAEVLNSSESDASKRDVLLEIYYHQAICYRKLGDIRHAETILTALQRVDPDSHWGNLASDWLGKSGLPGYQMQLPYWIRYAADRILYR